MFLALWLHHFKLRLHLHMPFSPAFSFSLLLQRNLLLDLGLILTQDKLISRFSSTRVTVTCSVLFHSFHYLRSTEVWKYYTETFRNKHSKFCTVPRSEQRGEISRCLARPAGTRTVPSPGAATRSPRPALQLLSSRAGYETGRRGPESPSYHSTVASKCKSRDAPAGPERACHGASEGQERPDPTSRRPSVRPCLSRRFAPSRGRFIISQHHGKGEYILTESETEKGHLSITFITGRHRAILLIAVVVKSLTMPDL